MAKLRVPCLAYEMIFFAFAFTSLKRTTWKCYGWNLKVRIFVVYILRYATFRQILNFSLSIDSLSIVMESLHVDCRALSIAAHLSIVQLELNLFVPYQCLACINSSTLLHATMRFLLDCNKIICSYISRCLRPYQNLNHNPIFIKFIFSLKVPCIFRTMFRRVIYQWELFIFQECAECYPFHYHEFPQEVEAVNNRLLEYKGVKMNDIPIHTLKL